MTEMDSRFVSQSFNRRYILESIITIIQEDLVDDRMIRMDQ